MKNTITKRTLSARAKRRVRFTAEVIKQKYRLDGRTFTRGDFERICDGERIEIAWGVSEVLAKGAIEGMHFRLKGGQRFIALAGLGNGEFSAFVAAHELGHAFLGHDGASSSALLESFDAYKCSPAEMEANYFASLITGEEEPNAEK